MAKPVELIISPTALFGAALKSLHAWFDIMPLVDRHNLNDLLQAKINLSIIDLSSVTDCKLKQQSVCLSNTIICVCWHCSRTDAS